MLEIDIFVSSTGDFNSRRSSRTLRSLGTLDTLTQDRLHWLTGLEGMRVDIGVIALLPAYMKVDRGVCSSS